MPVIEGVVVRLGLISGVFVIFNSAGIRKSHPMRELGLVGRMSGLGRMLKT